MIKEIEAYNAVLAREDKKIADALAREIEAELNAGKIVPRVTLGKTSVENEGVTSKVWHRHPVWFIDGNPIVGYSKQKRGMRLMFWSGADFGEKKLDVVGKKFKDASIFYTKVEEIDTKALTKWLKKATKIQWDYKNIVKRKGKLERLS